MPPLRLLMNRLWLAAGALAVLCSSVSAAGAQTLAFTNARVIAGASQAAAQDISRGIADQRLGGGLPAVDAEIKSLHAGASKRCECAGPVFGGRTIMPKPLVRM